MFLASEALTRCYLTLSEKLLIAMFEACANKAPLLKVAEHSAAWIHRGKRVTANEVCSAQLAVHHLVSPNPAEAVDHRR